MKMTSNFSPEEDKKNYVKWHSSHRKQRPPLSIQTSGFEFLDRLQSVSPDEFDSGPSWTGFGEACLGHVGASVDVLEGDDATLRIVVRETFGHGKGGHPGESTNIQDTPSS